MLGRRSSAGPPEGPYEIGSGQQVDPNANPEIRKIAEFAKARSDQLRRARSRAEAGTVIPPPAVLGSKLALSRGLRVLVHADPTFMAMNALKRQFELILGVDIHARALSIDRLRGEIV